MLEEIEMLEDHADARLGPRLGEITSRFEHTLRQLVTDVLVLDRESRRGRGLRDG